MKDNAAKLLLTRSDEENKELELKLSQYFSICSWSLINYYVTSNAYFCEDDKHYNIVITSKFAAKVIVSLIKFNISCFVVGKTSTQILQQNKFINIEAVYDTADKLIFAISHVRNILYCCGNYTSFNPPTYWKTRIIYKVKYTNYINNMVRRSLSLQEIDYTLIYSYNTGQNLIRLLKNNKLLWTLQYITIICISQRVGYLFRGLAKEVCFPTTPTSENMIKILLSYYDT